MLIVSSQPEKVEPSCTSKSGVGRTEGGDRIARIYPALVDPKVLLGLCVVVERNSRASGKWHQPECVSRRDAQWTSPDARLIVRNVSEALFEMRQTADYGFRRWMLLVIRRLVR